MDEIILSDLTLDTMYNLDLDWVPEKEFNVCFKRTCEYVNKPEKYIYSYIQTAIWFSQLKHFISHFRLELTKDLSVLFKTNINNYINCRISQSPQYGKLLLWLRQNFVPVLYHHNQILYQQTKVDIFKNEHSSVKTKFCKVLYH